MSKVRFENEKAMRLATSMIEQLALFTHHRPECLAKHDPQKTCTCGLHNAERSVMLLIEAFEVAT